MDEISLERSALLLRTTKTIMVLVMLRAVIAPKGEAEIAKEIIYTVQSLSSEAKTQYLLTERLHDCYGNCLADAVPDAKDATTQRAWIFPTYNEATYLMGIEWLLATNVTQTEPSVFKKAGL